MTLADYAIGSANVVDLVEPFASRVLSLCDYFGGRLKIDSGFRSNAEQWVLWRRYGAPRAAYPGTSNHERGLAVDFELTDGLTWIKVHGEAPNHGLRFPLLPYEDWHCEADPAWSPAPAPDVPTEDDMTKQEYADAIGAVIPDDGPFAGKVCVPLENDSGNGVDLFPFAVALSYTHAEMKRARLRG